MNVVLGYSSDLLPFVGEHPSRPGVFLLAGFTGHGMPRIPVCAEALSSLVASRLPSSSISPASAERAFREALPSPYILTQERLDSQVNLILGLMGAEGPQPGKRESKL